MLGIVFYAFNGNFFFLACPNALLRWLLTWICTSIKYFYILYFYMNPLCVLWLYLFDLKKLVPWFKPCSAIMQLCLIWEPRSRMLWKYMHICTYISFYFHTFGVSLRNIGTCSTWKCTIPHLYKYFLFNLIGVINAPYI